VCFSVKTYKRKTYCVYDVRITSLTALCQTIEGAVRVLRAVVLPPHLFELAREQGSLLLRVCVSRWSDSHPFIQTDVNSNDKHV
jgi:hypothetical protein